MTHNWSSWKDYQNSSWSHIMVFVWTSSSAVMETRWKPSWFHSGSWVSIVSYYSTYCLESLKGYSLPWSSWTSGTPALSLWTSRIQSSPFECRQVCGFTQLVAESVFTARLLKSMRENAVDIDSIADHLHQTSSSTTSTPSKNDQPVEFIAPLGHEVVTKLKALQPQKTQGQALRCAQALEAQLKAAQNQLDQLAAAGLSDQPQSHTISPKQPPKGSPSSAHLGSAPERKARKTEEATEQKLPKMFLPQEA